MAISSQIQDLLDQVKLNTSIEQSADLGIKALTAQISDLAQQVTALQAQIAAGQPLGADDIAAVASAVNDLKNSATTLQGDIPANTQPTPAPAPAPTAPTTPAA